MILSKQHISKIVPNKDLKIPNEKLFSLPEKVLQFGTGVLLRGLPDHLIDEANRNGIFNGRIVVVKSTGKGGTDDFDKQGGLYTLCVRGLDKGVQKDEKIINASISRVLSAKEDWKKIMTYAADKDLQVIISNTTETGIKLVREGLLFASPPESYPGKLVVFLYERFKVFKGNASSGLVILPTELISENGKQLRTICIQLAELNHYESDFIHWLQTANDFCNTLVDRIVPGALPVTEHRAVEKQLGYSDKLMIMAEPYYLWAIETTNERTKKTLSFVTKQSNAIICDNIYKYKEIKLRLLNASHTFSCALALQLGFTTVKQAMENKFFRNYISGLIEQEIIPAIVGTEITLEEAKEFASKVIDRFANPFIAHEWLNISAQYTLKLVSRCIKVIENHYKFSKTAPKNITLGFAAYILFMRSRKNDEGKFIATIRGKEFLITDDKASILHKHWQLEDPSKVVKAILKDETLWDMDLTNFPDFEESVLRAMDSLSEKNTDTLLAHALTTP
ncbi:altronate oxidoreductase [Sphingobacteriaceae bacterium]|nr:altronate oxidoreductase [Sphingobacteriaceae bacterium]